MTRTCGLLFSGGKDSALAALLLEPFYEVTLVTAHFGITDSWQFAHDAGLTLGFPTERIELKRTILETAAEQMRHDGYPRNGIQYIHEAALEGVAKRYDIIADGTRRDDRVPTVSRASAQSLEDRHDVDYIAPLLGFGRAAINDIVDSNLVVESGPSEAIAKADYETELRAYIREVWDEETVNSIFPPHEQTRVIDRR